MLLTATPVVALDKVVVTSFAEDMSASVHCKNPPGSVGSLIKKTAEKGEAWLSVLPASHNLKIGDGFCRELTQERC